MHCVQTWDLGLEGGVWACPAWVDIEPGSCTPLDRERFDGGTRVVPGGGEDVAGGVEVPVLWLGSTDAEEAELWSLKRDRSFMSKVWISSLPAVLEWSSVPSDSTGCDGIWVWGCWAWMVEFTDWEGWPLSCSNMGADPTTLGVPVEAEVLLDWGPATAEMDVRVEEGEMVEDGGGMLVEAVGGCGAAVSWEGWEDGMESETAGCDRADAGGEETLPVDWGGKGVAVEVTDSVGKAVPGVEAAAASEGDRMLEMWPASEDGKVTGSCSGTGGSRVLLLSIRACFTLLKASWRTPDGAERERPEGAVEKENRKD